MSHHFDTKVAREDPSLNLCDFYLFEGAPGTTVMAMTVNPDAGLSASDVFHVEGLYAFRFDANNDLREEITFKVKFDPPTHKDGDEHIHIQQYQVRRASGQVARHGAAGEVLISGKTGEVSTSGRVKAYAGMAPELFAGDAFALHGFLAAFYKEQRYDGSVWQHREDFFAHRNVTAIVLEVPTSLIGTGKVHAWATVSLHGHAPEVQVSRWGLPLITHVFLNDPERQDVKEQFNTAVPAEDVRRFAKLIEEFSEKMSRYAGSVIDPQEYGKQVAARLCPTVLPYELGTPAAFDYAGFNGRPMGDDVMDVMLTLASNMPLADGVAPDRNRIIADFPYYGAPYASAEQAKVIPVPRPAAK